MIIAQQLAEIPYLSVPLLPLATATEAENAPIVLTAVLLNLVVIYLASKIGGEVCKRLDFPPVLGELIAGVLVGVSALHLLVFSESGATASDSLIMSVLQAINGLNPDVLTNIFESQSEVISVLAELGVILLLFEIGFGS